MVSAHAFGMIMVVSLQFEWIVVDNRIACVKQSQMLSLFQSVTVKRVTFYSKPICVWSIKLTFKNGKL